MDQNVFVIIFDEDRKYADALGSEIHSTLMNRPNGSVKVTIHNSFDPAFLLKELEEFPSATLLLFMDVNIADLTDLTAFGTLDLPMDGRIQAGARFLQYMVWPKLMHLNRTDVRIALMSEFSQVLETAKSDIEVGNRQLRGRVSFLRKDVLATEGQISELHSFLLNSFKIDRLPSSDLELESSLNGRAILFAANALIEQIKEFRAAVWADNHFAVHETEVRDGLLKLLDDLQARLDSLLEILPKEVGHLGPEHSSKLANWFIEFKENLESNLSDYSSPENIAKSTVPLSIVLGCGTIGALVGGPIGFGAGSLLGQYVAGHVKPGVISDRLRDAFSDENER